MNEFFKPTRKKVIYAGLITFSPVVIFAPWAIGWPDMGWFLVAMPVWFIYSLFPEDLVDIIVLSPESNIFVYVINPLLSFLLWYLVSCGIVFFTKKGK
jgi:hypothetical protein